MANKSDIVFRTAISGYNKNDVNEYIEASEIKHKKLTEEYEAKIHDLEKKLASATERAENAENKDFSSEAEGYEKTIAELNEKIAECEKIIAAKTEENAELALEIDIAQEKVDQLSRKIGEVEALCKSSADSITKAAKYDEVSARIGEIFLAAEARAEAIVTAAQEKSGEILAQTEEKRKKTEELLNQYAETCRNKISEMTVASAKERLDRLNSQMQAFEETISKTFISVKEQSSSFEVSLDDLKLSIQSNLDTLLCDSAAAETKSADNTDTDNSENS